MKVLITGSSGMIGKYVVEYLTTHHHEPIGTDIVGEVNRGDVVDRKFVFDVLSKLEFDAIVHLAGVTDLRKTVENPHLCYEVNCLGTLNMLELGVRKNVKRFLFACYDERTRVFTTEGIKHQTELHVGDLVFTINPSSGVIETQPIKQVYVYSYNGSMIHFDGRRIDLLVTPNHKMLVAVPTKLNGQRIWRTVFEEAEVVAGRSFSRLVAGRWIGADRLPPVFRIEMPNVTDLYYLTGLFIGDGNLNGIQFQVIKSGLSKTQMMERRDTLGRFVLQPINPVSKEFQYPRIFLHIPEQDKCRHGLEEVLRRNSLEWSGYKKCIYLNSEFLYKFFEQCYDGKAGRHSAHRKRIPRWMLNSEPKLLYSLLQGLLDSDGSRGRMLSTVSPGLVEDTMELCAKLGYFTSCSLDHNVSQIEGRVIESTCFNLYISSNSGTPMFGRSYDNVHSEHYEGNVFCIEVENHNFLVERNGKIAFSGNSSANVYGAPSRNPVEEDAPLRPRVPYDYSKTIAEALARSYFQTKKLPIVITRSWLLFGENDLPNRAVPRFINACLRNEPINLFNSGRDTTAPSHAVNYARLVTRILESDASVGEVFNFGGDMAVSIRELAEIIKRLTNSSSQLVMLPPRSEQEKEPQVSYPNVNKVKKLLAYTYEFDLEEGLTRTIDSYKRSLTRQS